MNSKFENNEDKYINKKLAIISGIIVFAIVGCFFATYFITDRLTNPKYVNNNAEEEKTVYNNTKALDDNMILILMNEGIVEKEQSISEFKKENFITSEISQQFIVNFFEANGYNLEELQDEKVVFNKDGTTNVLQPNKYYIGEKDGYFAIYKTDADGKLTIENEDDVYRNSRPISFLKGEDLDEIKKMKNYYDTKDEAIEKLTAYIS
ncbi:MULTISPECIES: hypothetical protein [unclassified Clostridium]|uniref:hypothetical protein n=1 Tax=Clostridium TaxID=1485 RepID=UPI001C8CDBD9|nr:MULTISPECIES: hypothetical protein [unclassified Clostridium]MBX9137454.1 hypothetical protein [Clostridium sp. K12(2020)]MBX9144222.1 hypothetical protein [Clostridium sp. K13]MDU2290254.1 hypothetical protein [Clostridium celatum]MDU4326218.1 hypothetical protein [Clostridium celatum]